MTELYRLMQAAQPGQAPVQWAEADDPDKFRDIVQYHIDSAKPEGLGGFYVVEYRCTGFTDYCKEHGITRRTFEERIAGTKKGEA